MYNYHKILALLVFTVVFTTAILINLRLPKEFVGHLITFFSIIFGFYLTGLSILFGSNYSKRLRREEDPKRKSQTKLHTLKAYFSFSAFVSLSAILVLLFTSLLGYTVNGKAQQPLVCQKIWEIGICPENLFSAGSIGLAAINVMFMCLLFRVFFNGFLEEGVARSKSI